MIEYFKENIDSFLDHVDIRYLTDKDLVEIKPLFQYLLKNIEKFRPENALYFLILLSQRLSFIEFHNLMSNIKIDGDYLAKGLKKIKRKNDTLILDISDQKGEVIGSSQISKLFDYIELTNEFRKIYLKKTFGSNLFNLLYFLSENEAEWEKAAEVSLSFQKLEEIFKNHGIEILELNKKLSNHKIKKIIKPIIDRELLTAEENGKKVSEDTYFKLGQFTDKAMSDKNIKLFFDKSLSRVGLNDFHFSMSKINYLLDNIRGYNLIRFLEYSKTAKQLKNKKIYYLKEIDSETKKKLEQAFCNMGISFETKLFKDKPTKKEMLEIFSVKGSIEVENLIFICKCFPNKEMSDIFDFKTKLDLSIKYPKLFLLPKKNEMFKYKKVLGLSTFIEKEFDLLKMIIENMSEDCTFNEELCGLIELNYQR
ncbi:MAG: hypothetical protein CL760_01850 [Chloroflexi bacterium]|nr:hypothetical protein [Chloroflexota bacterium]